MGDAESCLYLELMFTFLLIKRALIQENWSVELRKLVGPLRNGMAQCEVTIGVCLATQGRIPHGKAVQTECFIPPRAKLGLDNEPPEIQTVVALVWNHPSRYDHNSSPYTVHFPTDMFTNTLDSFDQH